MKISTAFSDWQVDGPDTATNTSSGLMWMRNPVKRTDAAYNEPLLLDWTSATAKFGKGAKAGGPSEMGRADLIKRIAALTSRARGYAMPQPPVTFAGYSNWRLPTVEEVVSVTFSETWGCRKLQAGRDDGYGITRELFSDNWSKHSFWTANSLKEPSEIEATLTLLLKWRKLQSNEFVIAWAFSLRDTVTLVDLYGEQRNALILVREHR